MRTGVRWMVLAALIGGCDRARPTAAPATAPAVPPTTLAVTLRPATQSTRPTFMLVGRESIEFPPARLVVKQPSDKLSAMLFSVDPADAIKKDYHGNSFYFDLAELNLDDPKSIDGAVWTYKALDSERQDTNDGLFINGRQVQLQPFDVQVLIDGDGPAPRVKLAGSFLKFDASNDAAVGTLINVRADFETEVRR